MCLFERSNRIKFSYICDENPVFKMIKICFQKAVPVRKRLKVVISRDFDMQNMNEIYNFFFCLMPALVTHKKEVARTPHN